MDVDTELEVDTLDDVDVDTLDEVDTDDDDETLVVVGVVQPVT